MEEKPRDRVNARSPQTKGPGLTSHAPHGSTKRQGAEVEVEVVGEDKVAATAVYVEDTVASTLVLEEVPASEEDGVTG